MGALRKSAQALSHDQVMVRAEIKGAAPRVSSPRTSQKAREMHRRFHHLFSSVKQNACSYCTFLCLFGFFPILVNNKSLGEKSVPVKRPHNRGITICLFYAFIYVFFYLG
jgi:hypothetical protein